MNDEEKDVLPRKVDALVRCCMNCSNGESAFEKYGELMHEYEKEDVFCYEQQELHTDGLTFVCDDFTPNKRITT